MKIRVVVLMGGKSDEHNVSMSSGKQVVMSLDTRKYDVLPVIINKSGNKWLSSSVDEIKSLGTKLENKPQNKDLVKTNNNNQFNIQKNNFDKNNTVVFIALHGKYGEDGSIQGMLDLTGIKYTGSGVLASALGMDKNKFRLLMGSKNILTPKYLAITKIYSIKEIEEKLRYPMFVKPNNGGSSIGAGIAQNREELIGKIKEALKYDNLVLIDEFLKGKELTCAVIGNEDLKALPVVEIKPLKGSFFDYKSKYTESGSEEIVPARITEKQTRLVEKTSLDVYELVGCRGFARIDFILVGNKPYLLEINTIPGLTPMSLLPKAAKAAGITYSKLIEQIIEYSLEV